MKKGFYIDYVKRDNRRRAFNWLTFGFFLGGLTATVLESLLHSH